MLFWALAAGAIIALILLILALASFYFLGAIFTVFAYGAVNFFIPSFGAGEGMKSPVLILIFWPAYFIYLFYYCLKLILNKILPS